MVGAKLSEHKFLRILRGFAESMTVQELAGTTHVTERTIRETYKSLRAGLRVAASINPEHFGMAGTLLLDRKGSVTASGEQFLVAVRSSRFYRRHKTRHAPRLRCPDKETELVLELGVRILCSIDMRHLESEAGQRMALKLLADAILKHHPRKPLSELSSAAPSARPNSNGQSRFFEDYRRYLLTNPLTSKDNGNAEKY